ncbi:MAG TPA: ABC transporter permease [Pyrinomonadaceae bacterium]
MTTSKSAGVLDESELAAAAGRTGATTPPQPPPPAQAEPRPPTVIEPSARRAGLGLAEVWAHRELLFFLTWRDVKVRYKQTALGAAWAVLQPVFMTLVFTVFFGRMAGLAGQVGVPYPLFALAGLVPWTFFANTLNTSGNSLVNNAGLITKVYFPRVIVPVSAVAAGFVDFVLAFAVLAVLMAWYGVTPTASALMLFPLVLFTALFSLAVGMWVAALNVKYRDVRFVMPFATQLWLFVSSVILPSSAVGGRWRSLLLLNPMSGLIEGYRSALFGQPFDWRALGAAAAITLAALAYSAYSFRRTEKHFADIV